MRIGLHYGLGEIAERAGRNQGRVDMDQASEVGLCGQK